MTVCGPRNEVSVQSFVARNATSYTSLVILRSVFDTFILVLQCLFYDMSTHLARSASIILHATQDESVVEMGAAYLLRNIPRLVSDHNSVRTCAVRPRRQDGRIHPMTIHGNLAREKTGWRGVDDSKRGKTRNT